MLGVMPTYINKMMNIELIRIKNLFGEKNYEIRFEQNRLILVAENGSGKTTIVNIIYFFISRQWTKLLKYEFELIEAVVSGETMYLDVKVIFMFLFEI